MEVLKVDDVLKTYGKKESQFMALSGINLSVKKGESLAIVGKSGSGKSTLMHIMALLDKPDNGHIFVNGKDVRDMKAKDLNILRNEKFGFVFQQFFMNPRETVLENVQLPLKIAGIGRSERKKLAMKALEAVDLVDKAKNKATALSGGQKQRVCIARAIVNNPEIIFADEPTGNLDSKTGDKVEKLLFKLKEEKGITLIIVTHDMELANKCDRQIVIRDGQIVMRDGQIVNKEGKVA
ncbi:MAG: ABC transporter ATP-binding protein [Lachnospiraceae bacterium]|jgi:putative ABC transport system ATP-binding protein|nr:ABC transporter ATP-binding protein [Lachnospiraceae bacterium]